jgi:hypothetical protein
MLLLYFQNLDNTTSNRAMWAEQNGDCWNYTSNRVNKMAAEVGKERSWQDDSLRRLEHKRAPDTSSNILVPGYNFNIFRVIGSHQLATKLKFCIRVSGSSRRYNALFIFSKSRRYNIQSRDVGGTKWRLLDLYVQSHEQYGGVSR